MASGANEEPLGGGGDWGSSWGSSPSSKPSSSNFGDTWSDITAIAANKSKPPSLLSVSTSASNFQGKAKKEKKSKSKKRKRYSSTSSSSSSSTSSSSSDDRHSKNRKRRKHKKKSRHQEPKCCVHDNKGQNSNRARRRPGDGWQQPRENILVKVKVETLDNFTQTPMYPQDSPLNIVNVATEVSFSTALPLSYRFGAVSQSEAGGPGVPGSVIKIIARGPGASPLSNLQSAKFNLRQVTLKGSEIQNAPKTRRAANKWSEMTVTVDAPGPGKVEDEGPKEEKKMEVDHDQPEDLNMKVESESPTPEEQEVKEGVVNKVIEEEPKQKDDDVGANGKGGKGQEGGGENKMEENGTNVSQKKVGNPSSAEADPKPLTINDYDW